jgi:hypothetical protein
MRMGRCMTLAVVMGILFAGSGCRSEPSAPSKDVEGPLWPMESGYICVLAPQEFPATVAIIRMVFVAEAVRPAYEYWKEHEIPTEEVLSAMRSEGWDIPEDSGLTPYTWAAYLLKKAEKEIDGKERTLVEAFFGGTYWWFREISEVNGCLVKKPLKKTLHDPILKYFWPGRTESGDVSEYYVFHTETLERGRTRWERQSEPLTPSRGMRKCLVKWKGGQVNGFITSNEWRVVSPGLGLLALGRFRKIKPEDTDKSHVVGYYLANLMVPSKKILWVKRLENLKVIEE